MSFADGSLPAMLEQLGDHSCTVRDIMPLNFTEDSVAVAILLYLRAEARDDCVI